MSPSELLTDIFAGYVNQQTLADAAEMMVFVSADDLNEHERFVSALDHGLAACEHGDQSVVEVVNLSGYKPRNIEETRKLLGELRVIYQRAYKTAQGKR